MLQPHYLLLADLKAKVGEEAEAQELRRQALKVRLTQANSGKAHAGAGRGGAAQRGKPSKRGGKGASTARAGGRRV